MNMEIIVHDDESGWLNAAIKEAPENGCILLEPREYFFSQSIVIDPGKKGLTILGQPGTKLQWIERGQNDALYGIRIGHQIGSLLELDNGSFPTKRPFIDDYFNTIYEVVAPKRRDASIHLTSSPNVIPQQGDIWYLYDLEGSIYNVIPEPYKTNVGIHGWLFKVSSYDPLTRTVYTSGDCPHTFAGVCKIVKMTPYQKMGACDQITLSNLEIEGLSVTQRAKQKHLISAQGVYNLFLDNITIRNWDDWTIDLFACTNVHGNNIQLYNGSIVNTGRGIGLHNCTNVSLAHIRADKFRHVVVVTDGSANVAVTDAEATNQGSFTDAAYDTHGNGSYNIEFNNVRGEGSTANAGNYTFLLGDEDVRFVQSDLTAIRMSAGTKSVTIRDTVVRDSVYIQSGKTLLPFDKWYRGKELHIESSQILGGIKMINSPGLDLLKIEDSEIVCGISTGMQSVIDAVDFRCDNPFVFVLNNCMVSQPNRTDGKPVIDFWGQNTKIESMHAEITNNTFYSQNTPAFSFRSTGFAHSSYLNVCDNRFIGITTLFKSVDPDIKIVERGNTIQPIGST